MILDFDFRQVAKKLGPWMGILEGVKWKTSQVDYNGPKQQRNHTKVMIYIGCTFYVHLIDLSNTYKFLP